MLILMYLMFVVFKSIIGYIAYNFNIKAFFSSIKEFLF